MLWLHNPLSLKSIKLKNGTWVPPLKNYQLDDGNIGSASQKNHQLQFSFLGFMPWSWATLLCSTLRSGLLWHHAILWGFFQELWTANVVNRFLCHLLGWVAVVTAKFSINPSLYGQKVYEIASIPSFSPVMFLMGNFHITLRFVYKFFPRNLMRFQNGFGPIEPIFFF